ncbi:hypothetical protein GSI_04481 [Ganoderma sinense ZZ0214-1]|uniref:Protein kinase domain-containing protein n=1 Tax=Ganoderma sinense ZZ0214-1 TaxID=1077348 RepID=A0A2G8SGZ7_9APHY|nr:hypothetical protein GSI_04481 [Ganoderma sinense ZZ0214-1]
MLTQDESEEPWEGFRVPGGTTDEPFPYVDLSMIGGEDGYSWYEMRPFWRAYRPWLASRGFHLFKPFPDNMGYFFPPPNRCLPALPYATYANLELDTSSQIVPSPRFAPARDQHMRDVMIKLVKKDSEEHRIYEELLSCSEFSERNFPGVLSPVAILSSQHDFSFIVMPRWGEYAPLDTLESVGAILSLMRCLLKGLAFLHSRRIVHRDIDFHNIIVNYYTFGRFTETFLHALEEHRRGPDAFHCLMDFDRSLKFPPDTSLDACRLPAEEALVSGTPYHPSDLNLAEHNYNPFAYDVGCLGNLFRINYAEIVPIIPMLAPLFDQMTTHVISERFKASGALAFFEDATRELPADVLCTPVQVEPDWGRRNPKVYWAKVPPGFIATPGLYRTPPPSLARRLLDIITNYTIGWKVLIFLRSVLRI